MLVVSNSSTTLARRSILSLRVSSAGSHQYFPGTATDAFHSYTTAKGSMDDLRSDTSGVKYYMIFGKQTGAYQTSTIGSVNVTGSMNINTWTDGDGLVPLVSASRTGSGLNYNRSDISCSLDEAHIFNVADRCQMVTSPDYNLHVSITGNANTLAYIDAYLLDSTR